MASFDKPISKSAFKIKITSETVQKLQEDEAQKVTEIKEIILDATLGESKTDIVTPSREDGTVILDKECPSTGSQIKTGDTNVTPVRPSQESDTNSLNKEHIDSSEWDEYSKHIIYEGDLAIYKDPATNIEYTWRKESESWGPRQIQHSETQSTDRVYSYENDVHIYTEQDGSKFFWDPEKNAWFPKVDDDFLAVYQMNYGFVDNTTKEAAKGTQEEVEEQAENILKRKAPQPPTWFEPTQETNTKVYVSNLPEDVTEEEFVDLMQKYGLVMRDPTTQKMKIKLYKDTANNCLKGDALCTYIKIESVELALKLLDGSDFKGRKLKVERAQFQMKGDYNPALKPKKKKKKELEKIKRMQEKLFDWRPEKIIGEKSKHERVVIIENLFHPSDFDKDVQLILDYQQDLREECGKCGEVKKVVIYDRHPDGIAQVTMADPEQAESVVALIDGRWFGKRQIKVHIWDGKTKYKIAETEADMKDRLGKWDKFLGAEEKIKLEETENKEKKPNPDSSETLIEETIQNKISIEDSGSKGSDENQAEIEICTR